MASISRLDSVSKTCHYCAGSNPSKICSACKGVFYCNQECQRKDWPSHKKVCRGSNNPKVSSAARSASVISQKDIVSEMEEYLLAMNDSWEINHRKFGEHLRTSYWQKQAKNHQGESELNVLPLPGGVAFDLGAGNGKETKALLEKGYKVVAIDSYQGFVKDMNPLQSEYGEVLTVLEKDIGVDCLPQDGTADLILAMHSLFYCSPAIQIPLLRKIYSALKPGGMFFASYLDQTQISKYDQNRMLMASWFFSSAEQAKKLLEALGFRVLVVPNGESFDVICFKREAKERLNAEC